MPNREQVLNEITNFLVMRYNAYQAADEALTQLSNEQAVAIVSQLDYYEKIRYEFTVAQLSETLPLSYSSIHWALNGAYGGDIRMRRHPAELVKRGIYVNFTRPASYRFEPSLIKNKQQVILQQEVRPEQIKVETPLPVVQETIVEKECERRHMNVAYEPLHDMLINRPGFTPEDDYLVNNSTAKAEPVVGMAFLTKTEVDALKKAFPDAEYSTFEPIKKPSDWVLPN